MNWIRIRIIDIITESGLRGRGGAGFPTGRKWRISLGSEGERKYVVCNGDEGDPGAFMDRMLLESFPFRIIEGLMIAGYATKANEGIFYIRAEYPLAVSRIRNALEQCYAMVFLEIMSAEQIFHSISGFLKEPVHLSAVRRQL